MVCYQQAPFMTSTSRKVVVIPAAFQVPIATLLLLVHIIVNQVHYAISVVAAFVPAVLVLLFRLLFCLLLCLLLCCYYYCKECQILITTFFNTSLFLLMTNMRVWNILLWLYFWKNTNKSNKKGSRVSFDDRLTHMLVLGKSIRINVYVLDYLN